MGEEMGVGGRGEERWGREGRCSWKLERIELSDWFEMNLMLFNGWSELN